MERAKRIDLNCDMGEGFGIYRFGEDEALLEAVTSANIACGFHAGDPSVMKRTVRLCLERGVAVGAHPGLPDLMGFGRRAMAVPADEIFDLVLYQIGALALIAAAEGAGLAHVKPHGALYHMASGDRAVAEAVAEAAAKASDAIGRPLMLFAPPGSELAAAGGRRGLVVVRRIPGAEKRAGQRPGGGRGRTPGAVHRPGRNGDRRRRRPAADRGRDDLRARRRAGRRRHGPGGPPHAGGRGHRRRTRRS